MKVLQVNSVYGSGSTGIIVRDIQRCCLESGIEGFVSYSLVKKEVKVQNGYKIGNVFSNKIHALLCRIGGQQGYFSHISTWKLLRYISELKPDIVHLHNLHNNYINLPMLLRYLAKHDVATVLTLHDCWFFTGGCSHFTSTGCFRWKLECGHCPRRYEDFPAYLFDTSSRQLADRKLMFQSIPNLTVVGASNWIVQQAKQNIFANRKCLAIHNGTDTEFFKPTTSDFCSQYNLLGKYVIVSLAAKWYLSINKSTINYLTKNVPNDVVFVLIGDSQIKEQQEKVIHLGFIHDRKQLRDIFSAADLFVNLTREDTLPTVNLEVQACGTPIVAYDNTGVAETIASNAGFTAKDGDYKTLTDNILICREKGKQFFSENCRRFVCNNFDRKKNYKQYINLYQQITIEKIN